MEIDEATGPETETEIEVFNRMYGNWARDESITKVTKGEIAKDIQVALNIKRTKYFELRTAWIAMHISAVTMNIEGDAENYIPTFNSLSIPGIKFVLCTPY